MSDELSTFVLENYAKAVKMDLAAWLLINPAPVICENKFDGIRVFLFKSGDKLLVSSKHGGLYTPKGNPKVFSKLPEFVHAPHRMILDGEYVSKVASLHFFDILRVDDRDLRTMVLQKRREVLSEIVGSESIIKYASSIEEIGQIKKSAIENGYEGLILKNPLSTYGQNNSWLKLKKFETIDCFVLDYEETQEMKRTGSPRSWFVGVYDNEGNVVNLGKVGSFVEEVNPNSVKIGTVVEIKFQEVTRDKRLREPFILKIRHDKIPTECLFSQVE
ncbi:MAG: ATP-dependent DNA ligase [Nitrososphaerales archaeon]